MPEVNPFIEQEPHTTGHDSLNHYLDVAPIAIDFREAVVDPMNPYGGTEQNAAGTAENLALHVATIVAFAMVGVYLFRASGFKFVVAGSVG